MSANMKLVKNYLMELGLEIKEEDAADELFIVSDEENGITDLIVDCEDPILIIEQLIMPVPAKNQEHFFERLLQMNGTLVHGAFVLDEEGKYVFLRDTLEMTHLDLNELEGSIRAISLALVEHGTELLDFNKQ